MNPEPGIANRRQLAVPLALSGAIVALLVIASAPGIFVASLYHDTSTIIATDRGTDLVALVLVVPALAVSIFYSRRGSLRAQIVWLGLVAWTAYNYAVYAYGLNFTPLFLVYVAILSLAVFTLALMIRRVNVAALAAQIQSSMPRRVIAIYLWAVGALFSFLWLTDAVPASLSTTTPARLAALHTTSNPVEINDLAVIIPTLVLAGIWTWQRRPIGYLLAGVMLGLATVTLGALLPGAPIFGGQTPDPVYAAVSLVSLIIWVVFLSKVEPATASMSQPAIARSRRRLTEG